MFIGFTVTATLHLSTPTSTINLMHPFSAVVVAGAADTLVEGEGETNLIAASRLLSFSLSDVLLVLQHLHHLQCVTMCYSVLQCVTAPPPAARMGLGGILGLVFGLLFGVILLAAAFFTCRCLFKLPSLLLLPA